MEESVSEVTQKFASIATEALAASTITDAPTEVVDAVEDAATGVSAILALSEAAEERIGHWDEQQRQGLVPKAGADNQRREATENAQALKREAERHFTTGIEKAEAAILASGLPTVASDAREGLARQELDVALGSAQGPDAASRLLGLASSGSPEVQAVLNTPYARTALIARGVEGVDAKLTAARKVIVQSASTEEAQKALGNLERLGALNSSFIAASRAFHHALGG
jgi:hypothetical protein